ncbi:hypothetical protein PXD04_08220 [Methanosphaera sp. ISO3-F5]|uniref:hypothetical protein n=1 Tax=Methanosphaera sp. ISO3-F5 TaxID=1452353 RepID=UPI002B25A8B9|nr:hypothetical protein [Methanosphaera sp. ISO3-F5]WQH63678.1 hypothetical protein PXD04_08220 [Methanosphaera sp. ISO3-F5]
MTIPIGIGLLLDIQSHFVDTDVTIRTSVNSMDTLNEILDKDHTLGFKSKQDFINFENQGTMLFRLKDNKIEIRFVGDYDLKDINIFINAINNDFKKISNIDNVNLTIVNEKSKQSFKIPSNLKDEKIINSILKDNYLGFSSKKALNEFQNKGEIILKKNDDETLDFLFIGNYNKKEAENYVKNISDEYALLIQEQTYLKVLERIENENLNLESEIIDNEDSIILTLNIN